MITDRHIALAGLGLGLIGLLQSFNKPVDNTALFQTVDRAISAAKGTYVCVSWDCTPETQAPVAPVGYQRVDPGTQYVDTQGQPLPTFEAGGNTYLVTNFAGNQ